MGRKSLVNNSIAFVAYKLMYVLFPLITSVYISHVLLAKGIGKIASAQNLGQYFVLIAALGIPTYGIREIAKTVYNTQLRNKTFSELFIINALSTILCTILYYLLINTVWVNIYNSILYGIVGLSIPLNILNVDWFYQGIEEFSYITKRSFIVRVISLILIFTLVRNEEDVIVYAIIYVLGISGNYLLNFANLYKYGVRISTKEIELRLHLKPIIILLCTTIAIELYSMVDVTMLTLMVSEELVGYYANSMKIVRIIVTVMAAIGGVLLPRLSQYYSQRMMQECKEIVNRVVSIILFLIIPSGVGIFIISNDLVPVLFGESFSSAIITLKILSFLVYSLAFFDLFGTQVLITFHDEKKLLLSTLVGAILNVIMNSILIPLYNQNGAAVASVLSQLIVTIMLLYYAYKRTPIMIGMNTLMSINVATVVMAIALTMIYTIEMQMLLRLVISIILGVFLYFGIAIILKNDVALYIIKIINNSVFKREAKKEINDYDD